MSWRGKERGTCHESDEVVTNEIYPDMPAIESHPNSEVDEKYS
jgi:hypothetical protein